MVRNLIVVLVLAIVVGLVYDHGRTISEADVKAYYIRQNDAANAYDGETLCKGIADDFEGKLVEHTGGQSNRKTYDKASACEENIAGLKKMKLLSDRTQGFLSVDFDYEIKSIRIAPDSRLAEVEVTSTARLGDVLLVRARGKDQLSRSFWRVKVRSSEGRAWNYAGQ